MFSNLLCLRCIFNLWQAAVFRILEVSAIHCENMLASPPLNSGFRSYLQYRRCAVGKSYLDIRKADISSKDPSFIFILFQSFKMTEYQIAVVIPQVHSVPLTISEPSAFSTLVLLHPASVSIWSEAVLPYVDEIVLIYIALMEVGADASACGNGTVDQYRCDRKSCLTCVQMVPDFSFIFSKEAFAAIAGIDASLLAGLPYEFHQTAESHAVKLQVRIISSASDRKDRE